MNEIKIEMVLSVPVPEDAETLRRKFLDWIEAHGWKASITATDVTKRPDTSKAT